MIRPGSRSFRLWTKPLLFAVCLLPLGQLLLGAFGLAGIRLGANPVEAILHSLGLWALRFLLLTLSITPLRNWLGWGWLLAYRRMLGLFAFFYASLHFTTYLVLDRNLDFATLAEDILERPYITIGFTALLLMLPLALSSTRAAMRRLGRRWQQLHRLVYVVAVLAVWHFYWQVKLDTLEPLVYAVLLAILLGARIWHHRKRGRAATSPAVPISQVDPARGAP